MVYKKYLSFKFFYVAIYCKQTTNKRLKLKPKFFFGSLKYLDNNQFTTYNYNRYLV